MLAVDLDGGKAGRQGRAGHDCPADRVGQVSNRPGCRPHIDRTDAKTHALRIDAVEIDKLFERQPEAGVVKARSLMVPGGCSHGAGNAA